MNIIIPTFIVCLLLVVCSCKDEIYPEEGTYHGIMEAYEIDKFVVLDADSNYQYMEERTDTSFVKNIIVRVDSDTIFLEGFIFDEINIGQLIHEFDYVPNTSGYSKVIFAPHSINFKFTCGDSLKISYGVFSGMGGLGSGRGLRFKGVKQ